jgi:hypothetical protein
VSQDADEAVTDVVAMLGVSTHRKLNGAVEPLVQNI